MKTSLLLSVAVTFAGPAAADPVLGVLEYLPVLPDSAIHVSARPTYILTNQLLTGPTVFSGLVGSAALMTVVCCYEVRNPKPLSLDKELAKYAADSAFVEHMKGVQGHTYIYAAEPLSDATKRTPLMKTIMRNMAAPNDGSPFTVAVVGTMIGSATVRNPVAVADAKVTVTTQYDKKTDRIVYRFAWDKRHVVFTEPSFPD